MATPLRRVYDNLRTGKTVLRDANRLRSIVAILARHGFGAYIQSLKLQDGWVASRLVDLAPEVEDLPFEHRVFLACQDLGPTFVKLGQMLSTRADLLPPALISELQTLQDQVTPMTLAEVEEVICSELGQAPSELFSDFSPEPLASASIAQVHSARLRPAGVDVVVKVQRPNLEEQMSADLEIMAFLARALESNFPEMAMFSPTSMVDEFAKAILKEIDFTYELENLEHFRANFAGNDRISFPMPFREYSSTRVLTMERVFGTKISQLSGSRLDVDEIVRTTLSAVLQMIYADGFFHGDLHPGNIFVRDDGSIRFIDVGLCGQLSPRERDALTDMLVSIVTSDWEGLARLFWTMTIHSKDSTSDYRAFEADVMEQAPRWFAGRTAAAIEFSMILRDMIALALKHRVRMPAGYTMTFKAVITIEGVGKQLSPQLDLLAEARPYVARVVAERYQPRRLLEGGVTALRELTELVRVLPPTARHLLDDVKAGRARISVDAPQLDQWQKAQSGVQHRMVLASWAAVLALCGTMSLNHGTTTIFGIPLLSWLFFLLAIACATRYLGSADRL